MKNVTTWILTCILALAFAAAGSAKLTAQPMMVSEFATFGYPAAFMYFTGALEIVAVVLILLPRVAAIGAGLICCIMAGALVSHFTHGQASKTPPVFVLLILAITLGSLRKWSIPGMARTRAA
jgi:uncharacterized membrane protein YphA (DoxX/SURF4 family)